ncbi:MAG: nitrogenase component 1 [Syntrophales bacterium]|nr:nitrogenase component 1 [Syntrophales bacterium]
MELILKRMSEIYEIVPDPRSLEREKEFPGYYTHWCNFMQAFYHLAIQDGVVLVHGPQGCVGNVRSFLSTYVGQFFGHPFLYAPTTDLGPSDVILGAKDKLEQAIIEVDQVYKPKVICLTITCAAAVTKEPVEEVVSSLQNRVKAKILIFNVPGIKNYAAGFNRVEIAGGFCKLLKPPEKKIPNSVNILGMAKEVHHPGKFLHDSHELERLLNKVGIRVNSVLLQSASIDDFERASEAEFNTFNCPQWGYPLAKYMKDHYGIPCGTQANPLGVTAISRWLREVGSFFKIEEKVEALIQEEFNAIKALWDEAKDLVTGKIALIDGGDPMSAVERPVAWGKLCSDLGMRPILYNVPPIEIKGIPYEASIAFRNAGEDFEVVYSDYAYHRRLTPWKVIEALGLKLEDISLYLGDVFPEQKAEWNTPIFDASNSPRLVSTTHCTRNKNRPGRKVGFKGAEAFAKGVINAVKTSKRWDRPTVYARLGGLR